MHHDLSCIQLTEKNTQDSKQHLFNRLPILPLVIKKNVVWAQILWAHDWDITGNCEILKFKWSSHDKADADTFCQAFISFLVKEYFEEL